MKYLPDHPTSIAILLTLLTMIVTSLVQWRFLIGLRRKHPDQWRHAGSPTIWSDQSILSAWPTVRYLHRKEYELANDSPGAEYCRNHRLPMVIGYWITIAAFISAVAVAMHFGWPPGWN